MKKQKKDHGGCKDIFRAFLIENAKFSGMYDIPVIRAEHSVPRKLIRFSDACREKKDYNQWVMFTRTISNLREFGTNLEDTFVF